MHAPHLDVAMRALLLVATLLMVPLAGCVDLGDGEEATTRPESTTPANATTNRTTTTTTPTPAATTTPVATTIVAPTPTQPPADPTTPPAPPTPSGPTTPAAPPATPPPPTPAAPTPSSPPPATPTQTPPTPSSPPPTPEPEPAPWPREGSHVSYAFRVGQSFSGTEQGFEERGTIRWTYRGGDWSAVCEGVRRSTADDGTTSEEAFREEISSATPPHWPLMNTRSAPAEDERVQVWYTRGCDRDEDSYPFVGRDTASTTVNGAPRTVSTFKARADESDIPYDYVTEWSTQTGLVVSWSLSRYMTAAPYSTSGELTDTDAPM